MGYYFATSPCFVCEQVFTYNPHRVPSIRNARDVREPVCESCMTQINERRKAKGLEPFPVLPGAYDADEISNL